MKLRSIRYLVLGALVAAVLPSPASASFHSVSIVEVFKGPTGMDADFVELRAYENGQTQISAQDLITFDAAGAQLVSHDLTNVPDAGSTQDSVLIGGADVDDLFGVTPDILLTGLNLQKNGKVCFGSVDCVAWGNYTGSQAGVGAPAVKGTGLIPGLAIHRDLGGNVQLDAADDTDDSNTDFFRSRPTPRDANGLLGAATGGDLDLSADFYGTSESSLQPPVSIERSEGSGPVSVKVSVLERSATEGQDYEWSNTNPFLVEIADPNSSTPIDIPFIDDDDLEPHERLLVKLSDPLGGAVFSDSIVATVMIQDDEPDNVRPSSTIAKPVNGQTYGNLTTIKGSASDQGHGLDALAVGLRRNMKDGSCRWLSPARQFVQHSCGQKLFFESDIVTAGDWKAQLERTLPKSVGTKTRNYTAFSRATDNDGNVEQDFDGGRNKNKFEVN